jgi:DNA-binding MarR family transcriptional regulator
MKRRRLSTTLGYLLAQVCKAHHFRSRTLLDEIGLYRGQQFVLCALWAEEGITHSELAERLHVHPATVTNAIKRMERAGFVERRPDSEDQRVSRVYLTDAGREVQDAVEGVWAELEEQTLDGFSGAERDALEQFLERIRANLTEDEVRA